MLARAYYSFRSRFAESAPPNRRVRLECLDTRTGRWRSYDETGEVRLDWEKHQRDGARFSLLIVALCALYGGIALAIAELLQ